MCTCATRKIGWLPSLTSSLQPPRPFGALIFDCDGTLADTALVHYAGISQALAKYRISMPRGWYLQRVGLSLGALLDEIRQHCGAAPKVDDIAADVYRFYESNLGDVTEISPVTSIARQHHQHVPLAVASGGQARLVRATLRQIGLSPLFQTVVTVEDVRLPKPAPDLFMEAARRLGQPPAACVVYEDSDQGLEAARRAGMQCVDVRDAFRPSWFESLSYNNVVEAPSIS